MIVELELLLTVPVVTVKVAEFAFAPTVTEVGTLRVELLFERVTLALVGVVCVRVTVQVLDELGPRLVGLQESEETSTGAVRVTVVLAELLL